MLLRLTALLQQGRTDDLVVEPVRKIRRRKKKTEVDNLEIPALKDYNFITTLGNISGFCAAF